MFKKITQSLLGLRSSYLVQDIYERMTIQVLYVQNVDLER